MGLSNVLALGNDCFALQKKVLVLFITAMENVQLKHELHHQNLHIRTARMNLNKKTEGEQRNQNMKGSKIKKNMKTIKTNI